MAARRDAAKESFQRAAECIGEVRPGCSLFAITRGQFSMIDATLAVLDQIGRADISIWTWTFADYEIDVLRTDARIGRGLLVIDHAQRVKNAGSLRKWKASFGTGSVRYVMNHSKIVTLENDSFRLLLRGSMNLNFNPRFEQFDMTEGGADFALVKRIESELPELNDDATGAEVYRASRVAEAFEAEKLALFEGAQVWRK